jgi:hypothetical protein
MGVNGSKSRLKRRGAHIMTEYDDILMNLIGLENVIFHDIFIIFTGFSDLTSHFDWPSSGLSRGDCFGLRNGTSGRYYPTILVLLVHLWWEPWTGYHATSLQTLQVAFWDAKTQFIGDIRPIFGHIWSKTDRKTAITMGKIGG